MTETIKITDPVFEKREWSGLNKFFLNFIRDERDLPFVYLMIRLCLTTVPMGIILYTPLLRGWVWWLVAGINFGLLALIFTGPFTLMLHNTSHNKLFKQKYDWMNHIIPWFIGPFFGQSPETYYSHHIGMHHPENNMEDDDSTTLFYQRDSIKGFAHYYLSFILLGPRELYIYFKTRNRKRFLKKFMRGEITFALFCIAMSFISFKATLMVFIIPFFFIRFAMMAGNWGQHAFIGREDPSNRYLNSITCVNSLYNRTCFNDGYHIGHHLKPTMHWTDLPLEFQKNIDKYRENKAIIFEKVDFFIVWFFLMTKQYGALANHFVDIRGEYNSKEEIVAFLKTRTAPFTEADLAKSA